MSRFDWCAFNNHDQCRPVGNVGGKVIRCECACRSQVEYTDNSCDNSGTNPKCPRAALTTGDVTTKIGDRMEIITQSQAGA